MRGLASVPVAGVVVAAALGGAVLFLAACASSAPMRYYTLTEIAPETRGTTPPNTAPVRLDRVTIPGELDRPQLVRRVDETRLTIAEQDRWAAPLDEMIRRVLSSDLAARLPPGLIIDPIAPSGAEPRQSLSVDVQEFYSGGGCDVRLRATWTLRRPDRRTSQSSEDIRLPPGEGCSGAASLPTQMSRALAQLSDRLAAGISGGEPGH
jgi:uncharacterized lipoprotein YmbA